MDSMIYTETELIVAERTPPQKPSTIKITRSHVKHETSRARRSGRLGVRVRPSS